MPQTYRDVLRRLPLDAHLYRLLTRFSFFPSPDVVFGGKPSIQLSAKLADAIDACSDAAIRTNISAALARILLLDHPKADQVMLDAVRDNPDALFALAQCQSRHHRALWLLEHDVLAFERAVQMLEVERLGSMCQRVHFESCKPVRNDAVSRNAFQEALSAFYRKECGCGEIVTLDIWERSPGVYHIAVHVKDLPQTSLEFMNEGLHARVRNPSRCIAMQYAARTGIAEIFISGGVKYQKMLVHAFAAHLLGEDAPSAILPKLEMNLEVLRHGFFSQKAIDDGFTSLQVKSMTLCSPDGKLKTVLASSERRARVCVSRHVGSLLSTDNPIMQLWPISAADIKLYYAKGAKFLNQHATLAVTLRNDGSVSWSTYDDAVKRKLKTYFVEAGIMQPDLEFQRDISVPGRNHGDQ